MSLKRLLLRRPCAEKIVRHAGQTDYFHFRLIGAQELVLRAAQTDYCHFRVID